MLQYWREYQINDICNACVVVLVTSKSLDFFLKSAWILKTPISSKDLPYINTGIQRMLFYICKGFYSGKGPVHRCLTG